MTTTSDSGYSRDYLPGCMIHYLNGISSQNFVVWRIFVRMAGRLKSSIYELMALPKATVGMEAIRGLPQGLL
jgi:hypothetical protein